MRFVGRTSIITGAGSGIGRATACRLAQEGAAVVIADIDAERATETRSIIEEAGGQAESVVMDISQSDEIADMVREVHSQYGAIEVLINNAGVWLPDRDGSVTELDPSIWQQVIRTNLTGTYLMCRHVLPVMLEHRSGVIVNVASAAALRGWSDMDAYTASKGGVVSLTRSLAAEYGPEVRVNAVCPGAIRTPLTANQQDAGGVPTNLLRRVGQPEDVAAALAFLASDDAVHITGQVLTVDGGRSIRQ